MKKVLRVFLPILIVLAVLFGIYWFFLQYRTDVTAGLLCSAGDSKMKDGRYTSAARYYRWACTLQPQDADLALKLTEAYRSAKNYTKTEQTLVKAKAASPSDIRLYTMLSQVYVEQDKLLDAEQMLDTISDETMRTALSAIRPAAPVLSREDNLCSIRTELSGADGSVCYYTTDGSFPSLSSNVYTEPFPLPQGETIVCAVVVSPDGLVSQESKDSFLVDGLIEEVVFRDPALEALIRERLSRPEGAIRTNELWDMEALSLPQETVSTEDLAYFRGLIRLTVRDTDGLDYSFLRGLEALRYLEIDNCALESKDLEAISACPMLEVLILTDCGLTNVDVLASLSGMRILNLDYNNITSIDRLTALTTLDELHLRDNALTTIPSMQPFTGMRTLDLSHNLLGSVAELSTCPSIEELDLSYNKLTSILALANLPNLRILDASHNSIADVSPLASCVKLEELRITDNQLEQIDVFDQNAVIREIYVDNNRITRAPLFPEVCALELFSANRNALVSLDNLAGLPTLNYVYADYNEALSDVDALTSCPVLALVSVYETGIHSRGKLGDAGVYVRYSDAD